MLNTKLLSSFLGAVAAGALAVGCAPEKSQAELQADAKVTRADAEKIALGRLPNGTVKEAELEKEHGKLVWSFDIASPDSKDITEVHVNAITGQIVAVEHETPKEQEKEAKEKEQEKK